MPYDLWELYYNYRTVEADLLILLRYIDLKASNYKTTSAEIRKITLASCSLIETLNNEMEKELGKISRQNKESIPVALYRKCENKKCDLYKLAPILQEMQFNPWLLDCDSDTEKDGFNWWTAYNSIKHGNPKIATFESCINSVTAAFVLTVFLTSETKTDLFWNQHDSIKICTVGGHDWKKTYSSISTLRKQIWPDFIKK
jgi:hypothetical protein